MERVKYATTRRWVRGASAVAFFVLADCGTGATQDGGPHLDAAHDMVSVDVLADTGGIDALTDSGGPDVATDAARDDTTTADSSVDDAVATDVAMDVFGADDAEGPDVASSDAVSSDGALSDAACGAPGDACSGVAPCCGGACSTALGLCLAGSCGGAGMRCAAPSDCCSASCVGGTCQSASITTLDDDRDRVLDTLAQVNHEASRCAQWTRLDDIQKGLFLTHSDQLGNRSCMENASITSGSLDGSGNCGGSNSCRCAAGSSMAFAHVFKLWTVNGSDPGCSCTETSDGYHCCNGGGEWHRMFFTADDELIDHFRRTSAALPEWHASTDLAGPHAPFTQSAETQASPRGQTHFWANDSQAVTLARRGVTGVLEPHIVELDNDYNLLHDSNPEGCYGFFGLGCTYGRIQFRQAWIGRGNQAATTFRANGEPSSHSELAGDAVYAPRCPTSHVDAVVAPRIRRGAVIAIQGSGFTDCAMHVACGNVVHLRTHSGEAVITAGSPFDLAESAVEIRVQIPEEIGTGEAYAWVVVGGVLSNLAPIVIEP